MAISGEALHRAVGAVAGVEGVFMDANALAEDVALLAFAFNEEADFMAAVSNTCRALRFLVRGRVSSSELKYELGSWRSYHYQHKVGQGAKADCRVLYREVPHGIEVKGFGHRRIPDDFYRRMSKNRVEAR